MMDGSLWRNRQGLRLIDSLMNPVPEKSVPTILLVEDSARIRPLIKAMLGSEQFNILEAEAAEQALEVAANFSGHIDLLISDITLPGISGVALASELRLKYPGMKILYMSGHALPKLTDGVSFFVEKPFRTEVLLKKVEEILGMGTQR